jgi:hypothetical protein
LFWWTAAERHDMEIGRVVERRPPPWTTDEALAQYRITSPYRELDRVSRLLVRDVLEPLATAPPTDRLFNILVYRVLNPESYAAVGGVHPAAAWDFERAEAILRARFAAGQKNWAEAYRTQVDRTEGRGVKVGVWARRLRDARDRLPRVRADLQRATEHPDRREGMRQAHLELTCLCEGLGDFLAYEILCDCLYDPRVLPFSENDWVNVGPGAAVGLAALGLPPTEESIRALAARQRDGFARVGRVLRGPDLTLRGIEHWACEFGTKYLKALDPHPAVHPRRRYDPRKHNLDLSPWADVPATYWTAPEDARPARPVRTPIDKFGRPLPLNGHSGGAA